MSELLHKVYGCLLGGLIGDAMGAPVECLTYQEIEEKHGWVNTFEGAGTDDSAVKLIIIRALMKNGGHITCDELAESFLNNREFYDLFYIPVRNMFHKLEEGIVPPLEAGYGNMQSSSSAMSISPMGIINAGNPRQAALETFDVAVLVHSGPSGFCRDAACAMAAAVAQALVPGTTVEEVLEAATRYLHQKSAQVMIEQIQSAVERAKRLGDYKAFRESYNQDRLHCVISDSRETVPAAFALFCLADGDPVKAIEYGANFGRDTDTIGSMVGALCGAFKGIEGLKPEWVKQIEERGDEQLKLAEGLVELIRTRHAEAAKVAAYYA